MNSLKNSIKPALFLIIVVLLGACEDDFNSIGADLVGDNNLNTEPYDVAKITAYSKKINAVQTNGLPLYLLGTYSDPIYGLSEVSILSQLSLSRTNPDFGTNPVLDSVVLVLPYYSTVTDQTEDGTTYELDSVFGSAPVKISVYESNYFLRQLDPETNFEEPQLYYSNQQMEFENNLGELLVEETFVPSADEVVLFQESQVPQPGGDQDDTPETDTVRVSPRIRIALPVDFFQTKIIEKEDSQVLLSNANFQSYFRGLYLKAEAIGGNGNLAAINFASGDAKVVLYYTSNFTVNEEEIESSANLVLPLNGNVVNVYNNNFQVDLSDQDTENGEQNLYLKGGEGSIAVIELFSGPDSDGDGVSDELEMLREKNWLINEANLIFKVNETLVPEGEKQPERIFIYNLRDNSTLIDYAFDFSANETDILNSRTIHLGRLSTDENGNRYYKIRLTGHIRNVLNFDSTNVKLGLSVSQNVNLPSFLRLKDSEEETVSGIPAASVVSPEGTVLYGNNTSNEDKKLKLNIYYTKPE